jgi:hypothetical protein
VTAKENGEGMSPLTATKHLMELGFTFLAFFGIVLIAYGTAAVNLGNPWPPIDAAANWMSALFTLVAAAVVAVSVYFPVHSRRADPVTRRYVAPAIVALVALALAHMIWSQAVLPPAVTNGFAILALAASILRVLPFSSGT